MKKVLLLCCGLLAALSSSAQLTLDECRRLAREHYPEIRQYDLIRRTTQYTVSNARRAYLPQVSMLTQATWQTDVPGFPNQLIGMFSQQGLAIPGLNKDQYKVQLEVEQILWDGGKSRAERNLAQTEGKEAACSVDVDFYTLEGRVDNLYFGILLLDERIVQAGLTIGLLRSNFDKVCALQRNGVAMQADADVMEAELISAGQQLSQTEAIRASYRRMLSVFIGRELGDEPLLRPSAGLSGFTGNTRPELALFDARIATFRAQEAQINSSVRPRFGLFAQGYYGYPGLDYFGSMLSGDWSWNALVGIRMSWNFGGYYTKRNSLNKLHTAKQQVEVQREVFLFNNRLEYTEQSGQIAALRKALSDDQRIVNLRRCVREAAESKLRNGIIDTHDLLEKITEEADAASARSAREIELLQTMYELKHTANP